jgi:hypothetical protein
MKLFAVSATKTFRQGLRGFGCLNAVGSLLLLLVPLFTACGPQTPPTAAEETKLPQPVTLVQSRGGKAPAAGPQAELATAFNASNRTLFEAKTAEDFLKVKAAAEAGAGLDLGEATLSVTDAGLIVQAGEDPRFVLPAFAQDKKFILQVTITSPVETTVQVFYKLRNGPYSELQSQIHPLKTGENVVYFRLDQPGITDSLRLDPGDTAGIYIIKSIVARGL